MADKWYIYRLHCNNLTLYVGHAHDLKRREVNHRRKILGTAQIPNEYEWVMEQLEECNEPQKRFRERYWYDKLMPLYNIRVPKLYDWEIKQRQEAYAASLQRIKS